MATQDSHHRQNVLFGRVLWLLTALFALRVTGQAVQRWMPSPHLPAFPAFQGSSLNYPLLLFSQLLILACMGWFSHRCGRGAIKASRRSRNLLFWAGGLYMAGAMARIAIGLFIPDAPPWFKAWIPGVFHLVLAGYSMVMAAYHSAVNRRDQ